jgi:hypothetical protein
MERDIWILLQSVSPGQAAIWIIDKLDAIGDPEFGAIYLEYDAAFGWPPDDPRLYALAERTERWIAGRYGRSDGGQFPVQDPALAQLVATAAGVSSPAWDRLTAIARERAAGG